MEEVSQKEHSLPIRNIERIQEICSSLVTHITHDRYGVSQKDLTWLETERRNYRTLRAFYAVERSGRPIPKRKAKLLAERAFTIDKVSEDETFVASELLDALHTTYVYIDETDPKKAREGTKGQEIEYVNSAVKANIEFADFFIKIHQRFNLKDEDLYSLFDLLFEKAGITRELEAKGLDQFPGGVLAMVRAYLHLSSQLPNWNMRVPEVQLDRDHAVDLIAEKKKADVVIETRYFEIKGRHDTKEVQVTEITEKQKKENLKRNIILNTRDRKDLERKLASLDKLFDFASSQGQKGRRVRAFWVEVPSTT